MTCRGSFASASRRARALPPESDAIEPAKVMLMTLKAFLGEHPDADEHAIRDQRVVGGTHFVQDGGKDVPIDHGRRTWVGSRRLTQFRSRVKKPRVLHKRVAVGHTGDEIGDVAQPRGLIALGDLRPFRRHVVGLLEVAFEQRAH